PLRRTRVGVVYETVPYTKDLNPKIAPTRSANRVRYATGPAQADYPTGKVITFGEIRCEGARRMSHRPVILTVSPLGVSMSDQLPPPGDPYQNPPPDATPTSGYPTYSPGQYPAYPPSGSQPTSGQPYGQ